MPDALTVSFIIKHEKQENNEQYANVLCMTTTRTTNSICKYCVFIYDVTLSGPWQSKIVIGMLAILGKILLYK